MKSVFSFMLVSALGSISLMAQESKPILRVYYSADQQGNWYEESRILMTYDAQGRQIAYTHHMLSEDKTMWHIMTQQKIAYDGRGNQVFLENKNYSHSTGQLSQITTTEQEYNEQNRLIVSRSKFDYVSSNQNLLYEASFYYDAFGCVSQQNVKTTSSHGSNQQYKLLYENDSDCNYLVYDYIELIAGTELPKNRKVFTYDMGLLIQEEDLLFNEANEPYPAIRKNYVYNTSGLLKEQTESHLVSDVYPDLRFRYYYNEQDKLILSTSEYLLKGSNDWTLSQQEEFDYNNLGLKSSVVRISYSDTKVDRETNTFVYNENKQIIEEKRNSYQTNDAGTNLTFEQYTYYTYTCDGRLLETLYVNGDNFSPSTNRRLVEIYPDRPACDPLPAVEVSVFPNPSKGLVQVVWNKMQSENNEIILLNSRGELMQRYKAEQWQRPFEIDLSGLSEGMYFVRIKGSAGEGVRRVYLTK